MHMFCNGMYIALVRGLYAPAGQFLPPFVPGHTMNVWPEAEGTRAGSLSTLPVAPSMFLTTFWNTVGRAHKNSPVLRSSVYTMPVLPGMPVMTWRRSPGRTRGLIHATSLGFGATAV